MPYFVVANEYVMNFVKTSKYFSSNLGMVSTIDNSGRRVYNDKDKFAFRYNNAYKTTIYMKGNIGDIIFYSDSYIYENKIAFYDWDGRDEFEEYCFDFDLNVFREKGIDNYLGFYLKSIKDDKANKPEEVVVVDNRPIGDPNLIFTNPGAVTFADVKAYLDLQSKNRYKV